MRRCFSCGIFAKKNFIVDVRVGSKYSFKGSNETKIKQLGQ